MREKYESLSATALRDVAKSRGIKNTSTMKKADLVEAMLAEDAKLAENRTPETAAEKVVQPIKKEEPEHIEQKVTQETHKEVHVNRAYSESRQQVEKSVERTIDRASERPTERTIDRTSERPSDRSIDRTADSREKYEDRQELDSGQSAHGILEVMPDGYGFIRCENYMPGENDVYVSPSQIRKFNLKTGDIISGNTRVKTQTEKFSALLYITTINGYHPSQYFF
jgi:transcription termination factor Rho